MLVEGKIPVGQLCPYRGSCPSARDSTCHHRGVEHTVPYSCGTARLFKIYNQPVDALAKCRYNQHIATKDTQ